MLPYLLREQVLLRHAADGGGKIGGELGELRIVLIGALAIGAQVDKRPQLSWLELDKANFAGIFKGAPVRDEMNEPPIREQYVVEYYSR